MIHQDRFFAADAADAGRDRTRARGCSFSLLQLLTSFAVVSLIVGLFAGTVLPALHEARKHSKLCGCLCHLKQLSVYLSTYVSRYGGDVRYPGTTAPAGFGGGVAAGPNGAFWGHLWRLPAAGRPTPGGANPRAVAKRPAEDSLFTCGIHRSMSGVPVTTASLDFGGPDLTNLEAFPGGAITERVRPDTFIGGDLVLPGDCNHDPAGTGPNFIVCGLQFDGAVRRITPDGSTMFRAFLDQTDCDTGVRTR